MSFFRFFPVWLACAATAWATTVRPPSFPDLVDGSELVFRGEVLSVETSWQGEGANRHLATQVHFRVDRVLKGSAADEVTLEFLGGRLGGKQLGLAGLPRFTIGERTICFVENRAGRICPIRRLRHGNYRITTDPTNGIAQVRRDDGSSLATSADVRVPLSDGTAETRALDDSSTMTLAAFEADIIAQATGTARTSAR